MLSNGPTPPCVRWSVSQWKGTAPQWACDHTSGIGRQMDRIGRVRALRPSSETDTLALAPERGHESRPIRRRAGRLAHAPEVTPPVTTVPDAVDLATNRRDEPSVTRAS